MCHLKTFSLATPVQNVLEPPLQVTGISTLRRIFLKPCVVTFKKRKSLLFTTFYLLTNYNKALSELLPLLENRRARQLRARQLNMRARQLHPGIHISGKRALPLRWLAAATAVSPNVRKTATQKKSLKIKLSSPIVFYFYFCGLNWKSRRSRGVAMFVWRTGK